MPTSHRAGSARRAPATVVATGLLLLACAPEPVLRGKRLEERDGGSEPPGGGAAGAIGGAPAAAPSDGGIGGVSAPSEAGADGGASPPATGSGGQDAGPSSSDARAPDVPRGVVDAAPVALPGTTPSCTAPDDGRLLDLAATGPVLPATPAHAAGVWRPVTDGTPGTISFAVEASNPMRCSTANALRFRGSGFTSWGAVAQAFFDNGPVNLSAFSGVRFSLRASAPISVRLKVPDRQAYQGGGLCAKCDDDFGAELAVGTAWREYVVPFASMRQEGWGSPLFMAIDGKQIYGLELLVRQNVSFDLWIDGVTLTR